MIYTVCTRDIYILLRTQIKHLDRWNNTIFNDIDFSDGEIDFTSRPRHSAFICFEINERSISYLSLCREIKPGGPYVTK